MTIDSLTDPAPPGIEILYGRSRRKLVFPESVRPTVIRKPAMPVAAVPRQAVLDALARPVESDSIEVLAQGSRSACIVICDITRPVPNHLFLRPLVESLVANGIDLDAITLLVATGLHRPNQGKELEELIGDPWVLKNLRVINHDARDDSLHLDFGKTETRGTPVKINRHLAEADLKIATGLVEPHFMAGYSGGRKVIAPGVAHADTITTFHNYRFMSDPAAASCNLENNPLHEEQLEILKMLGGAHAINTVIDEERRLSLINFGEITASHRQAVEMVQQYCRVPVPRNFDLVITSGAGYPLDSTYYQTVKGMVGAAAILKPGGDLVIASQCSEGVGSPEYLDAQRRFTTLGAEGFLESLREKPFADIDEWQTQMQTRAMVAGNIFLFSELDASDRQLTGVKSIEDLDAFLQSLPDQLSIAVIPEGPYVVPYVDHELMEAGPCGA